MVYDRLAGLPTGRASRLGVRLGMRRHGPEASHFWRLGQYGGLRVTVLLHPPMDPVLYAGRKELSQAVWRVIADGASPLTAEPAGRDRFSADTGRRRTHTRLTVSLPRYARGRGRTQHHDTLLGSDRNLPGRASDAYPLVWTLSFTVGRRVGVKHAPAHSGLLPALCSRAAAAKRSSTTADWLRIEPDRSHPTGAAICAKGRASPELVEASDRLLYPLRRTPAEGRSESRLAAHNLG